MILLLLLPGCSPAAPAACDEMCAAAAALYGGCLADWGADWSAAGYADEADFLTACAAWGWEMSLLEADAGQEGVLEDTCSARASALSADDAACSAYTDIDWNSALW